MELLQLLKKFFYSYLVLITDSLTALTALDLYMCYILSMMDFDQCSWKPFAIIEGYNFDIVTTAVSTAVDPMFTTTLST